jgi:hypothetical protein
MTSGLAALEARLADELAFLQLPAPRWTPTLEHDGAPVADVAIVGAGMTGWPSPRRWSSAASRSSPTTKHRPASKAPGRRRRAWKPCAAPSTSPARRSAFRR